MDKRAVAEELRKAIARTADAPTRIRGLEVEEGTMTGGNQAIAYREIMDIKTAADYLGVSRSHLSHILAGKVPGVPVIPHIRAGRRALIRRAVIDKWLSEQENDVATSRAQ